MVMCGERSGSPGGTSQRRREKRNCGFSITSWRAIRGSVGNRLAWDDYRFTDILLPTFPFHRFIFLGNVGSLLITHVSEFDGLTEKVTYLF